MKAGALGLSTSRTLMHRDLEGNVLPGSYADRDELMRLMKGMAQGGGGLFEMASDFADAEAEFGWVGKLSKTFGIPVTFGMAPTTQGARDRRLAQLEEVNREAP